jgi:uncharacterized protein (TIGR02145 family)
MKYFVTFLLAALSLNAVGQTNPNYNPDYDANGVIGVDDLLGILSTFGDTWDSGDVIVGCTYLYAVEYNPSANVDDGSCTFLPDCAGVLNGTSVVDECGVCGGNNSSCEDACGVPNGDNSTCLDECGVLNGDNSTCTDNCGVVNGTNDCVPCGEDITHEGYNYSTVLIGEQCWFSENCRYLPEVSPSSDGNMSDPYYYVNGFEGADVIAAQATDNYSTYGVLYNWPAVMTEGICPSGWHIPTDGEFTELTDFLGGEDVAGAKMKEAGYDHWDAPNTGATNSSGWTGLPGGIRYAGAFAEPNYSGTWWSASEELDAEWPYSWARSLANLYEGVYRDSDPNAYAYSARCIRD